MKALPAGMPFLSAAQRAMRPISRDKADTLLLLGACVLVMAPHASHVPGWVTAAAIVLLIWRGWITFRGNRMPSGWILLPMSVAAMGGVYLSYKTFFGQEAGVAMLVLLLAFKLLEMRAKRDLFVVVFLSFFLILTNFLYSQSIGTAVMMIAAVILMLTAQLSFQYTGVAPPLKHRLKLGSMIFGLAVPLTLVLFILFPRIQGPLWGLPADAQAGKTGLSNSMAPGNISKLALSGDIAFRVNFRDPAPPQGKLYWRGPVLGDFDGRTWTPLSQGMNQNRGIAVTPRSAPIRYQVTLEPSGQRSIFALEVPQSLPLIADHAVNLTSDLQLLVRQPITKRIRYDAASILDFDLQANESPAAMRSWLALPAGFNPEARRLAARLRSEHGSGMEVVNAVLRHFREQPFSYTLEPPALGRHTVDDFLFSTRAGFCEHYSSAFVVLMRAAGIPARVVTGYQGGEINAVDGFMTVRQSDAHAWAEVWLTGRGWIRIDPTAAVAPNRVQRNLGDVIPPRMLGGWVTLDGDRAAWVGALQKMRQRWDAVNNTWNQWVLDYSPARQKSLMESLGFSNPDWRSLTALMFGLGMLVMLAIVFPLVRNRVKIDPVDALYHALCKQLARQGYQRAAHEGPQSYRQRLMASGSHLAPEKKAAAARFLEIYETIRYGAGQPAGTATSSASPHASLTNQLKSLLAACR